MADDGAYLIDDDDNYGDAGVEGANDCPSCTSCGEEAEEACTRCGLAFCSRECQRDHHGATCAEATEEALGDEAEIGAPTPMRGAPRTVRTTRTTRTVRTPARAPMSGPPRAPRAPFRPLPTPPRSGWRGAAWRRGATWSGRPGWSNRSGWGAGRAVGGFLRGLTAAAVGRPWGYWGGRWGGWHGFGRHFGYFARPWAYIGPGYGGYIPFGWYWDAASVCYVNPRWPGLCLAPWQLRYALAQMSTLPGISFAAGAMYRESTYRQMERAAEQALLLNQAEYEMALRETAPPPGYAGYPGAAYPAAYPAPYPAAGAGISIGPFSAGVGIGAEISSSAAAERAAALDAAASQITSALNALRDSINDSATRASDAARVLRERADALERTFMRTGSSGVVQVILSKRAINANIDIAAALSAIPELASFKFENRDFDSVTAAPAVIFVRYMLGRALVDWEENVEPRLRESDTAIVGLLLQDVHDSSHYMSDGPSRNDVWLRIDHDDRRAKNGGVTLLPNTRPRQNQFERLAEILRKFGYGA